MDYTRPTIAGSYLEHDASVARYDACVRACVHAGFLGVCADGDIRGLRSRLIIGAQ